MPRIKRKFLKQIISLGLSAALIYNTTVPAFGQEFFYNPQMPSMLVDNTYYDNTRAEVNQLLYNHLKESYEKKLQEEPLFARAEQIKYEILGDESRDFPNLLSPNNEPPEEINYQEKYLKDLNEKYAETKHEMALMHAENVKTIQEEKRKAMLDKNFSLSQIMAWEKEELSQEKAIYDSALLKADELLAEETDRITNHYDEFLKELQEGAQESFFQHIKDLFNEIMGIYAQDPSQAEEQILDITPVIISLVNSKGERLYDKKQRDILFHLYHRVVQSEKEKVGKDKDENSNPCEIRGYCPALVNSMMGIAVLSGKNTREYDSSIIYDTIAQYEGTIANTVVMLSAISSLLIMQEYGYVDKFLREKTEQENEVNEWEFLDYLNLMNVPRGIGTVNGKYLGKVSKTAEYSDGTKYQNAYFDLAQVLAEDGTQESLKMLRKYGVNKCVVRLTSNVQKETLSKYTVSCNGIMPFLVGSLLSGKSGADKYDLPKPVESKYYMGESGRIYERDMDEYNRQKNYIISLVNNYYDLANNVFNGDTEAMIALYVMNEGMGDLNAVDEYNLDTSLYNVFKNRIPSKFLGSKLIVVDEERRAKKEVRQDVMWAFSAVGLLVDIYLAVKFLAVIVVKGFQFAGLGRGVFNAIKTAKMGLTIKNIPALAKLAVRYTKNTFTGQKLMAKIANTGKKFRSFAKDYKEAVRLNVLQNAMHYTNAVHQQAKVSLNIARMGLEVSPQVFRAAKNVTYNKNLGVFKVEQGAASQVSPTFTKALQGIVFNKDMGIFTLGAGAGELPETLAKTVNNILDTATVNAKSSYRIAKLIKKNANFTEIFLQEVHRLIAASPLAEGEKEALSLFLKSQEFEETLKAANDYVVLLGILMRNSRDFAKDPLTLDAFMSEGANKGDPLNMKFVVGEKITAFSDNVPEYAQIVEENGNFLLKFFNNGNEIDLSTFKLAIRDSESFADISRTSLALKEKGLLEGVEGLGSIELKFIPKEADTFWMRNFRSVFVRNKESLFSGRGTVSILSEKGLQETGITLKTYKQYDGIRVVINEAEGGIHLFKGLDQLYLSTEGAFYIPKYALGQFAQLAQHVNAIGKPYQINLIGGINKMRTLYITGLVSLGVAFTGLHGALGKSYPNINTRQLNLITVALPFAFSFLAPFVSPLVKKYGAVRILKTSMLLSTTALAMPMVVGFHGFGGIQSDNPFDKPSPSLLYPSALMVGLASTLMRGASSPLTQAVGGGSGAMKMKAFKSISSFMLVLPPLLGTGLDHWFPKYFKNEDGTDYLDANGKPIQKHWFDFSFSYPFMLMVAGGALYKVQKAHFNVNIGKSAAGGFTSFGQYLKDGIGSYRTLVMKGMLPLTLGSLLLNGAESSLLYAYSNSLANEYVENHIHLDALVPVVGLVFLNLPAFAVRMNSKSILNLFGGDNMLGYRNMITTSMIFAGTGSYLLAKQDSPWTFSAGLLLTSIGFSNITASILRYGHHKLGLEFNLAKNVVTSWDVSYPTVYLGMSLVPLLHGKMSDKNIAGLEVDKEYSRSLKNSSMQDMLSIPISSLALGGGLVYLGMRSKNALNVINRTALIAPLGLVAESHNPVFNTLLFPKPTFTRHMLETPAVNSAEPKVEYNPNFVVPEGLNITPRFTIQPVSDVRR